MAQEHFSPELLGLLGSMGPTPQAQGPSKKAKLLEILPMLLAGGLGAAAGGSQGFGAATQTYGHMAMQQQQMKQRKEAQEAALQQQQLAAAMRYISEQSRMKQTADLKREEIGAAESRQKAGFGHAKEMAGVGLQNQMALKDYDFQNDPDKKPFTADNMAAVERFLKGQGVQGDVVPGRLAAPLANSRATGMRQEDQQAFTSGENQLSRENQAKLQSGNQAFQAAQQGRSQSFQAGQNALSRQEGEKDRQLRQKLADRVHVATQKALSGEASKVNSIASSLPKEIDEIKVAFGFDPASGNMDQKRYKAALLGFLSGTDRALVKKIQNAADKVGRLRSGGAINKEEETRFTGQFASFADLPFGQVKDAIATLDDIKSEADMVREGIAGGARAGTGAGASGSFEQPATETVNGMVFRVNPDGSRTRIK